MLDSGPATVRVRVAGLALVAALAAAMPSTAQTYVAFGDSITEGVGDEENRGGYPARLQTKLRNGGQDNAVVRNRGESFEDTTAGLVRINGVIAEGGDVMLIMEGTNDISAEFATETTVFNLRSMAQKVQQAGMTPVLATLVPRYQFAIKDSGNIQTQRVGQGVRDVAHDRRWALADVFEIYFNTPNFTPDLYSTILPGDGIGHPSAEGYDLVASVFADLLLGEDGLRLCTSIALDFVDGFRLSQLALLP